MNTSSPEELANYLAAKKDNESIWPLGIDGKDGVGKSELARKLAQLTGAQLISLDDFLEKHQDKYVESLRFSELSDAIRNADGPIIIEGVCLLAAIERIGVKLGNLIYVKRTRHGVWVDEEICHSIKPVNEVIEKEKNDLFISMEWYASQEGKDLPSEQDIKLPPLTEEIIHYHAKYHPSQAASHIFEAKHA